MRSAGASTIPVFPLRDATHRDELESASAQRGDEHANRIDRDLATLAGFVHQDDAAPARLLEHALDDLRRWLALPVEAVHVPQDEALRGARERLHGLRRATTVRRTSERRHDARRLLDRAIRRAELAED